MPQSASRADVAAVFDALAHEARRGIVALLSHRGGELPSGYLAGRFKHSWPTTSRHLKVLEDAGIVEVRRHGRSAMYRLRRERIDSVLGGWLRQIAPADPSRTWAPTGPRSTAALAARASGTSGERPARRIRSRDKSTRAQGAPPP